MCKNKDQLEGFSLGIFASKLIRQTEEAEENLAKSIETLNNLNKV